LKSEFVSLDPIAAAPDAQMRELVDDFLAAQRSPGTSSSYGSDVAIFLGWLAARRKHPLQTGRPDIDRYRNWLAEPIGPDGKPATNGQPRYAPATVARKLSAVRALYTYLTERRVLAGSPAAGVKGPQVTREPRGRAIGDEHVRLLLAAAVERGAQAEAMVCLLLLNGLRVTEVCKATIKDLQREPGGGHSLLVRGKGGKDVRVALNERTEFAVLAVAGTTRTSGPLFRRQDGRRARHDSGAPWLPYNRQAVGRLLIELGQHAGLLGEAENQVDRLYPHRLRHTFVTMLLDRDVPLPAVQDAARHASADTTRLYDRSRVAFREHPTHKLVFE
jgi:integrase/recombinase XerD